MRSMRSGHLSILLSRLGRGRFGEQVMEVMQLM